MTKSFASQNNLALIIVIMLVDESRWGKWQKNFSSIVAQEREGGKFMRFSPYMYLYFSIILTSFDGIFQDLWIPISAMQ